MPLPIVAERPDVLIPPGLIQDIKPAQSTVAGQEIIIDVPLGVLYREMKLYFTGFPASGTYQGAKAFEYVELIINNRTVFRLTGEQIGSMNHIDKRTTGLTASATGWLYLPIERYGYQKKRDVVGTALNLHPAIRTGQLRNAANMCQLKFKGNASAVFTSATVKLTAKTVDNIPAAYTPLMRLFEVYQLPTASGVQVIPHNVIRNDRYAFLTRLFFVTSGSKVSNLEIVREGVSIVNATAAELSEFLTFNGLRQTLTDWQCLDFGADGDDTDCVRLNVGGGYVSSLDIKATFSSAPVAGEVCIAEYLGRHD